MDGKGESTKTSVETEVKIGKAMEHFEEFMESMGLDLEDEHLRGTPERVSEAFVYELFGGIEEDPRAPLRRTFEDEKSLTDQFVIVDSIEVNSMCAHHFLPFVGHAHVGYIPDEEVVGLSKLSRVVDGYSRRPQVQERLTNQIADALHEELEPKAVVVFIQATHYCMKLRGVEETHSSTRTTALRGEAREDDSIKNEFFQSLRTDGTHEL
jgi:GTP cyclohydrolase I